MLKPTARPLGERDNLVYHRDGGRGMSRDNCRLKLRRLHPLLPREAGPYRDRDTRGI